MKYLIALPCMDTVQTLFMKSLLGMHRPERTEFGIACSSLVYDARNSLAVKAITEGFDRVLWIDSDMTFEPDMMNRLIAHLDAGKDIVSGLYITRKPPFKPVIFESIGYERVGETFEVIPRARTMYEYPKDSVFEIAGAGFGGVMTPVPILKAIYDKYGLPFTPMLGFGEDLSFCLRAQDMGYKMWCDSTIKLGHVGYTTIDEQTYLKGLSNA